MNAEQLAARFSELKNGGLSIDEKRCVASLRLCGKFSFTNGNAEPGGDALPVLSLDEDDVALYAPFRALSAALIECRGIDFSDVEVLKASTKLLNKQTVYTNHDTDVLNWTGLVVKSWWDDSANIPPGINVTLRINKKWNEKIIDGVKEGALHSVSVDVYFDFEKSHPYLENFWWRLGETVDGQVVRLIVTRIISYGEISLVWQGADIYAKRIDITASQGLGLGREINAGEDGMKLSRKQVEALGLVPSDYGFKDGDDARDFEPAAQEELIRAASAKVSGALAAKNGLSAALKIAGLDPESADLAKTAEDLKMRAVTGDTYLADLRQDAIKYAKLSEGETLSSALEKAITTASAEDAKKFRDDYKKRADEKFPVKCEKCGGTLTRGSAHRPEHGTAADDVDPADFRM